MWGGVSEAFSGAGPCCTVELSFWAGPLIRTHLVPASQAALRDSGLGAHLMEEETAVQGGLTASQGAGQSPSPGVEAQPTVPSPVD